MGSGRVGFFLLLFYSIEGDQDLGRGVDGFRGRRRSWSIGGSRGVFELLFPSSYAWQEDGYHEGFELLVIVEDPCERCLGVEEFVCYGLEFLLLDRGEEGGVVGCDRDLQMGDFLLEAGKGLQNELPGVLKE